MSDKHQIDMTRGPIFGKLVRFAIPIILSGLLQQLYNVADTVVVGKFDGTVALAAVGSTGHLINFFLLMFVQITTAAGVVVARYVGAGEKKREETASVSALLMSLVFGLAVTAAGTLLAKPMLRVMSCPENVIEDAALYMRIYFLGAPVSLLYNCGSALLRAHGDTKRPMLFLTVSGIINVILNVVLVVLFHLGVAGVAIATVASQVVSAGCVLVLLHHPRSDYRLNWVKTRFSFAEAKAVLALGVPMGASSILFNLANLVIQREINVLDAAVMAGSAAATNLNNITYLCLSSFGAAALNFAGQNVGAKKYRRLDTILWQSCLCGTAVALVVSLLFVCFRNGVLSLYIPADSTDRDAIVAAALPRLVMMGVGYVFEVPEDGVSSLLKAMGKVVTTVCINVVCIIGLRFLWIFLLYRQYTPGNLWVLNAVYPISWGMTALAQFAFYRYLRKRSFREPGEGAPACNTSGSEAS